MATRRNPFDTKETARLKLGVDKTEAFRAIPMSYWQKGPLKEASDAWNEAYDDILDEAAMDAMFYLERTEGKAAGDAYYKAFRDHYALIGKVLDLRKRALARRKNPVVRRMKPGTRHVSGWHYYRVPGTSSGFFAPSLAAARDYAEKHFGTRSVRASKGP